MTKLPPNGIIILNDDFEIENLNKDLYFSKMESIKKNFELSLKYDIIEDILYNEILKNKIWKNY